MKEQAFAGILDRASLQALVDALRQQARFAIVERVDAIDFPPPQNESISVAEWPKGRIFDEPFELRWEQCGQEYRVIAAGTNLSAVAEKLNEQHSLPDANEVLSYYCWNERDSRLGRTLNYRCVPGKGNVKLLVREFRDDHGRLVLWRYLKMERDGGER